MEDIIENVVIDLKYETIRKKSSYTLRITKTQETYKKELKAWYEDMKLLERISSDFI